MTGTCIKLLYASWVSCYLTTANIEMCGNSIKLYEPIYTMYSCPLTQKNFYDVFIEMTWTKDCHYNGE